MAWREGRGHKMERRARELADDCAPLGTCHFCGKERVPVVMSELHVPIAICEECCDGAICSFLNRKRLLARPKRRVKA
jgi:hypothetical protein